MNIKKTLESLYKDDFCIKAPTGHEVIAQAVMHADRTIAIGFLGIIEAIEGKEPQVGGVTYDFGPLLQKFLDEQRNV